MIIVDGREMAIGYEDMYFLFLNMNNVQHFYLLALAVVVSIVVVVVVVVVVVCSLRS